MDRGSQDTETLFLAYFSSSSTARHLLNCQPDGYRRSGSIGGRARLPTDAEWEYACRAGTTTRYSFGNSFDEAQVNATKTSRSPPLMPPGRFPANPFGLFDMHGNVNEMCWDGGREFSPDESVDPVGSLDARQPAVVRGGAISSYPARLRSSQRYINDSRVFPEVNFATTVKGFRVVAVEGEAQFVRPPDAAPR